MPTNKIEQEKKIVAAMIGLYCRKKHTPAFSTIKTDIIRTPNVLTGKINTSNTYYLCAECEQLLSYAWDRLDNCKFAECKPACRYCRVHCYKPHMRERMRKVMRFSGPRMIFHSPLAAICHLFHR